MAIHVVPIIYDHATKKILRWYLLDHVYQLNDAAFRTVSLSEGVLYVPFQLYKSLAGGDQSRPLLDKLQDYVTGNAP